MRKLTLVSGETKSDPMMFIVLLQGHDLSKPATPCITKEANLTSSPLPVVGSPAKTAISNDIPHKQPSHHQSKLSPRLKMPTKFCKQPTKDFLTTSNLSIHRKIQRHPTVLLTTLIPNKKNLRSVFATG